MDEVTRFNQSRWDELVRRGVMYSRPFLSLTPQTAREFLDSYGFLGEVSGQDVLCLASAGGQQSAAFAVLGAKVRVLDFSEAMLERDHQAAAHYHLPIDAQQGDMRDLSRYPDRAFDLVWQPYSLNFVADPAPVFAEVARVLRPGGFYHLQIHNPFVIGMAEEEWDGKGYPLYRFYENGVEVEEPVWTFTDENGQAVALAGPREFRHTLSSVINRLAGLGFTLRGLWEEVSSAEEPIPGSWDHLTRVAPPWLTMWFAYQPVKK